MTALTDLSPEARLTRLTGMSADEQAMWVERGWRFDYHGNLSPHLNATRLVGALSLAPDVKPAAPYPSPRAAGTFLEAAP